MCLRKQQGLIEFTSCQYYEAKLGFYVWLVMDEFKGAKRVYNEFVFIQLQVWFFISVCG